MSIVFEDDGPGIPEDNLETIFQRFYTSRPKGTSFGKNSGLGLSISRQIIEAHDGKIWAENRKDDTRPYRRRAVSRSCCRALTDSGALKKFRKGCF